MHIAKECRTEFIPLIKMSYQLFFKISALLKDILLIKVLFFYNNFYITVRFILKKRSVNKKRMCAIPNTMYVYKQSMNEILLIYIGHAVSYHVVYNEYFH